MIFDQMMQHQAINLAKSDSETKNTTEGNVDDGEGEKYRARVVKVFLTRLRFRSGSQGCRRFEGQIRGPYQGRPDIYIKEGSDIKDSCWERVSRFDHRALSRLTTRCNGCQTLAVFGHFLKPGDLRTLDSSGEFRARVL